MVLSVSEKSYIYESLSQSQPLRPDGRKVFQFRPLEISCGFLPQSYGSARVTLSDGSECIVSVKAKVVENNDEPIAVDIDIAGERDDSPYVLNIASMLTDALSKVPMDLSLSGKYLYKLFVDVVVLSCFSYPLSLISFGVYTALTTTQLPILVKATDDLETVEELPTFDDYDLEPLKLEVPPPMLFTLAIVKNNLFMDPSAQECEVAENGLVLTWFDNQVVSVKSIGLNETQTTSFRTEMLAKSVEMVSEYAPKVIGAVAQNTE